MAQQTINIGTVANDGTGDTPRSSFDKTNQNFTELYGIATPPQGRLTLQTATPVMTTTQSAKTTIYYTPYVGNRIPIYDGTNFAMTSFSELSVATTDTTKSPAAIGASKLNDWFVWKDAGTIRIGHGPDWTSDTARSAGTALVMVNGILLNNASITNGPAASRGTYVGTTRSNASSQLDWIFGTTAAGGGMASFNVWNAYNRVNVATYVGTNTASWTFNTGAAYQFAEANSATFRVNYVAGQPEEAIFATYTQQAYPPNAGTSIRFGIGYDSNALVSSAAQSADANGGGFTAAAALPVLLGVHFVTGLEQCNGVGNGYSGTGMDRTGLNAMLRM
jgi:hypothetical protein